MLTTDSEERKKLPVGTGVLDYFPDALAEVAKASLAGNGQHMPGEPLHWDRAKSRDESDALIRHFLERDKMDSDGILHAGKMAWRALAYAQKLIEERREKEKKSKVGVWTSVACIEPGTKILCADKHWDSRCSCTVLNSPNQDCLIHGE